MAIYFGSNPPGFYRDDQQRPDNAVEITDVQYHALIAEQATGARIVADGSGNPTTLPFEPTVQPPQILVTNFQARAALMGTPGPNGQTMFEYIDSTLNANKNTDASGMFAWQAWQTAGYFDRNGTLITTLGARFGLSPSQLDAIFIAAAQITA